MPDILVIKSKILLKTDAYKKLYDLLMKQKENGVVIVPEYCEAIVVPDDIEIRMEDENEIHRA